MSKLKLRGEPPFRGGTLDLELDGAWDAGRIGWIDLPLKVTLRGTTFSMPGVDPTPIDELVLPIGLSGPIDAPRIRFDSSALSDALLAAGKRELATRVQQQLEGELGDALDELKEKAGIDLPGGLQEKLPDEAGGRTRSGRCSGRSTGTWPGRGRRFRGAPRSRTRRPRPRRWRR
jgi:hypothetical protein